MSEENFAISGEVFTGLGEGKKYLSERHYKNAIKEKVGFNPFPGTLNLKVDPIKLKEIKSMIRPKRIKPIDEYIGINVYITQINGIKSAYLDLDKTDHDEDVMEIVAEDKLRKRLELEDGDILRVEFQEL